MRLHEDHIGRLLRTLGWTPQKPPKRARQRNEALIEHRLRSELAEDGKNARLWRAWIAFAGQANAGITQDLLCGFICGSELRWRI